MAARACKRCSVKWPSTDDYRRCPGCSEITQYTLGIDPDPDWEDRFFAFQRANSAMPEVDARTDTDRLKVLTDAGVDLAQAMELAGDHGVDLRLFKRLISEGCPLRTAVEIVR